MLPTTTQKGGMNYNYRKNKLLSSAFISIGKLPLQSWVQNAKGN